ncbi:hypothetical protein ACJ41O_009010 [Fusarium nematophilum]
MGLGILDPRQATGNTPGTVVLGAEAAQRIHDDGSLKRGTGKHNDIILTPQPSDDPNDPLNWPQWKKCVSVFILVLGASLCASTTGPLLNASLAVLAVQFNRPIGDITVLSGYQLLVAGASGPVVSALSRKYGKRPVYVFSSLACLIGTIIGSTSTTYNTLLAGRIVQGFAIAAYESLVFTSIGDLFFVHERGLWTMVMAFTLNCVSNLSSVVAGKITFSLGWHYLFHILNACLGLQLLLLFFFVPESCYVRTSDPRHRSVNADVGSADEKPVADGDMCQVENVESVSMPPQRKTFWQELRLFNGTFSDENLFGLTIAPFVACTNISALWTIVITGAVTSFYVAIAYVIAQLFSPPPYLLSAAAVGYMSLGPFIGGTVGAVIVGALLDPVSLWLTKRNNGIFEPEFRLALMPLGLLCGAGLFGFGALSEAQGNIYAIAFMWGLMLCGTSFIVGPCSSYAIDAFRGMSGEIFIANVMLKNFLFYGYSYFVNDWTATAGPRAPFFTFGGTSLGLVATTVIFYVYGKRYRAFWHKHNIMEKLNIKTHPDV